jgi:V/A-type H+-transporting ATPase subunit F
MKLFLISDNADTLMGMRLAGIDGVSASTGAEAEAELHKAAADPQIGILLISEKLASLCRDVITDRKLHFKQPLIEEVPDRGSQGGIVSALERYVGEAIGIKI